MVYPNGNSYEGEFHKGVYHGEGLFRFGSAGGSYRGGWRLGRKHGIGKRSYASGAEYEGEFAEDLISGKGIYKSAVGDLYVGSFKEGQSDRPEMQPLFDKDKNVLMGHLKNLPALCGMRKVDGMVKRISLNRINLLILGHLRSKMPYMSWAAEATKQKLILDLQEIYLEVNSNTICTITIISKYTYYIRCWLWAYFTCVLFCCSCEGFAPLQHRHKFFSKCRRHESQVASARFL